MKEKISVIIPTYNRASKILDSLNSIRNQTYKNLEIIIVDDCSADNTEELVSALCDNRVVYHKLTENKGAAGARNEGVKIATSDIIAFHDSDDICVNDRIETEFEYWKLHPEYDLIYSSYIIKKDDLSLSFPENNIKDKIYGNIYDFLLVRNVVGCPTVMMRKKDFLDVGGFNESYRCLEDWEFIIRFSKNHYLGFLDKDTIITYPQDDGLSASKEKFYQTRARMIAEEKEILTSKNLFNDAVMSFFNIASLDENLEYAKACLMRELYNFSEMG